MHMAGMKNNNLAKKTNVQTRRGVSPILATVILLGVTVVGGGLTFGVLQSGSTTAASTDVIGITNVQAIKGTGHADLTATVKNSGAQPWVKVEMTVAKTELSEPILYESLHENVVGCKTAAVIDGTCDGVGNGGNEGEPAGGRDNPLRAQWLISLDKASGKPDIVDKGEGASVGRKLVFQDKDDLRSVQVLNGTAIARIFGGQDQNGDSGTANYLGNIDTADWCSTSAMTAGSWVDCSAAFKALDASTKGIVQCQGNADDDIAATCNVFTHTNIKDDPVGTGQSIFFYADAFTQEIPGLNNQVLRTGDNIVINIFTENKDGGTSRVQTIAKVSGV